MSKWDHLNNYRIVRLNARLMPVDSFERSLYRFYNINPIEAEADTSEEIISIVRDCDGLFVVSSSLPKEVIQNLSQCRFISRMGKGTDKIDVEAATQKGIIVTNAPNFCFDDMADHAMAMLLSTARKIPQMTEYMRSGNFRKAREESNKLKRISELVLGIIGFGLSGRALAKRARSFGMRVIATEKNISDVQKFASELDVELVDLGKLLAESDFISLNLPLNKDTYHMFDEATLGKLKRTACLINTARGALIDETALAKALQEGWIGAACLDTFEAIDIFVENEKPPKHPLVESNKTLLTPHVSGLSEQATQNAHKTAIENLVTVLSGYWPTPENIVNPSVRPWFELSQYNKDLLIV
jgi:D-3-phosphoglycerate dehydrogenase